MNIHALHTTIKLSNKIYYLIFNIVFIFSFVVDIFVMHWVNINIITLQPGIKIAGGKSALGADFGVFVKKVLSGGVADLDGKNKHTS